MTTPCAAPSCPNQAGSRSGKCRVHYRRWYLGQLDWDRPLHATRQARSGDPRKDRKMAEAYADEDTPAGVIAGWFGVSERTLYRALHRTGTALRRRAA